MNSNQKTMFAFRHIRTTLWWRCISGKDTDELVEAALFPTKMSGARVQPDTMYEAVKIDVTLTEAKEENEPEGEEATP